MGVADTLEFFSALLAAGHSRKKKRKQVQTVELKVRMDCDGCVLKVKKALSSMKGMRFGRVISVLPFILCTHLTKGVINPVFGFQE